MTRLPTPPLPDRVTRQLNADGDEARISREAEEAAHKILQFEDEPAAKPDAPLVAGGQGRDAADAASAGDVLCLVLALCTFAFMAYLAVRMIGGAA